MDQYGGPPLALTAVPERDLLAVAVQTPVRPQFQLPDLDMVSPERWACPQLLPVPVRLPNFTGTGQLIPLTMGPIAAFDLRPERLEGFLLHQSVSDLGEVVQSVSEHQRRCRRVWRVIWPRSGQAVENCVPIWVPSPSRLGLH
jgi:hypothetical protein